ncbi:MAG TPA: hypothetical protein VKY29_00005, partial [Cryomorphaceae bacterium]|nr:hypothetical protein [Cryomorphaceae bacterium]
MALAEVHGRGKGVIELTYFRHEMRFSPRFLTSGERHTHKNPPMNHLVVYDKNTIAPLLNDRLGEDLWANRLGFVDRNADLGAQLAAAPGKFVLFGICEDIGVRANYGRPGAANAWPAALKRLVNIQVNPDNDLPKATLLGHL